VDAIRLQLRRQSNHNSLSSTRFVCLGVISILVLSWFVFRIGDQPVVTTATRPVKRPVAPPVQPPVSIPAPVAQPPPSATLDTNKEFVCPEPDVQEEAPPQEPAVAKASADSSFGGDCVFVRYLERRAGVKRTFPLLDERLLGNGGTLALGKLQAGYGTIFDDDSVITRGRNGTAWEETSFLFVKASFRF